VLTIHKPLTTAHVEYHTDQSRESASVSIYILIAVAVCCNAVIKVHPRSNNVKAKTNPNPDLQKTWK